LLKKPGVANTPLTELNSGVRLQRGMQRGKEGGII